MAAIAPALSAKLLSSSCVCHPMLQARPRSTMPQCTTAAHGACVHVPLTYLSSTERRGGELAVTEWMVGTCMQHEMITFKCWWVLGDAPLRVLQRYAVWWPAWLSHCPGGSPGCPPAAASSRSSPPRLSAADITAAACCMVTGPSPVPYALSNCNVCVEDENANKLQTGA